MVTGKGFGVPARLAPLSVLIQSQDVENGSQDGGKGQLFWDHQVCVFVGDFPHRLMYSESAACASHVEDSIPQAMTASSGHGRIGAVRREMGRCYFHG